MKIDGFENLLEMQGRIAKAITSGNSISNLAMVAKAVAAQQNKLRGMFPVSNALSQLQVKNDMLSMMTAINKKRFVNPILSSSHVDAISKIVAGQNRMQAAWHKMVDTNQLLNLAKNFRFQNDMLAAILKPAEFNNIDPAVFEKLGKRTEKAADITTEVTEKKYVTTEDLQKFEAFVFSSFNEVKDEIKKNGKSPIALISFWLGIICFLMSLHTDYIRPALEEKMLMNNL